MRKEFSSWIENFGRNESRFIFLTGDLGFAALEKRAGSATGTFRKHGRLRAKHDIGGCGTCSARANPPLL